MYKRMIISLIVVLDIVLVMPHVASADIIPISLGGDGCPAVIDPVVLAGEFDLALCDASPGVVYSVDAGSTYFAECDVDDWDRWTLESETSRYPDLAYDECDENCEPHVVYAVGGTYGDRDGYYSYRVGESWSVEQIEDDYFNLPIIINTGCDEFGLVYNTGSHNGGPLCYREYAGDVWTECDILSPSVTDPYGLAQCDDGRLGLVAAYLSGGELRYWEDTGTGWDGPGVITTGAYMYRIGRGGLAFDSNCRAYVSYSLRPGAGDPWELYLAWHDAGAALDDWTIVPVPGVELAVTSQVAVYNDVPYILYGVDEDEATDTYDPALAAYVDSSWMMMYPIEDRVWRRNEACAFEFDDGGIAHIAYLAYVGDDSGGELRYTTFDPCDLCSPNGCDYTCLNVDNESIEPNPVPVGLEVTVGFDWELSGTPGHIMFLGVALDNNHEGTCYSGAPGESGASGQCELNFIVDPPTPGTYEVYVAVAHVYNEGEFIQAIADGEADILSIGTLIVCPDCNGNGVCDEEEPDFDGDGLIDECDPDIDNDGVSNEGDDCDYTPPGINVDDEGRPIGDLDLDCDVDLEDFAELQANFTGPLP